MCTSRKILLLQLYHDVPLFKHVTHRYQLGDSEITIDSVNLTPAKNGGVQDAESELIQKKIAAAVRFKQTDFFCRRIKREEDVAVAEECTRKREN